MLLLVLHYILSYTIVYITSITYYCIHIHFYYILTVVCNHYFYYILLYIYTSITRYYDTHATHAHAHTHLYGRIIVHTPVVNQLWDASANRSLLTSSTSLLKSHRSLLTSNTSLLTSHRSLLTSNTLF